MTEASDSSSLAQLRAVLVRTAKLLFPSGDGRYVDALQSGFRRHAEIALAAQRALGDHRRVANREILALEEALRDVIAPGLLRLLRSANPFSVETAQDAHHDSLGSVSLTDATAILAAALEWERRMGAGSVVAIAARTFATDCTQIAGQRVESFERTFHGEERPDFGRAAIDVLRLDAIVWSLEALGRTDEIAEIRRYARRYARMAMEAAVDMLARRRSGGENEVVDLDDILVIAQRVIESDSEEMAEGRDAFIRTVGWDTVDAFGQLAEQLIADRLEDIWRNVTDGSATADGAEAALREVGAFVAIGAALAGPEAPAVYSRFGVPPLDRLASIGRAACGRDACADVVDRVVEICRQLQWLEVATAVSRAAEDGSDSFG